MKNFNQLLLKYLEDIKKELEEKGFIPTLEIAIEQLKESMVEKEIPKCVVEGCDNVGHVNRGDNNWCHAHSKIIVNK